MATYNQISYGSKGDEVKELQTLLKNNGYNLDVDGNFGPKTQAAVKAYQKASGLDVDGIVGTNTWGALTKANTSANTSASAASTPKFEYADYAPSDAVTQAQTMLNQHLAQKPGEYQSAWQNQLNDAINKIMNREKFSYDLNGDALYQQYKDQFTTQGKMASADVMGQAAAMTGGFGNSYAQTVGQQTYQGYLQQLNDKVPELYSLAYDRYNQEGQDLLNQYSLLSAQEEKDYGRHRDTVSDWNTERGYLTDSYNNERTYDRSIYESDRRFASDDWDREYAISRDKIADEQWQKSFDEGVRQFNASLKKSSVDDYDDDGVVDNTTGDDKPTEDDTPKKGIIETIKEKIFGTDEDNKKVEESKPVKMSYKEIVSAADKLVANGESRTKIAGAITEQYRLGSITKKQYDTLMATYIRPSATSGGHYTY